MWMYLYTYVGSRVIRNAQTTYSSKNKILRKTIKCNKKKWNVSFSFGRTRNAFSLISRKLLNKNEQMYSRRSDEHKKLLACCCMQRKPYLQLYPTDNRECPTITMSIFHCRKNAQPKSLKSHRMLYAWHTLQQQAFRKHILRWCR